MARPRSNPKAPRPRHFIKEWREERGLTQEQLAGRIDKSPSAVSQLETGATRYTQGMLEAIASALAVDPGDLLSRNPVEEKDPRVADLMRALDEQERLLVRGYVEALIQRRAA